MQGHQHATESGNSQLCMTCWCKVQTVPHFTVMCSTSTSAQHAAGKQAPFCVASAVHMVYTFCSTCTLWLPRHAVPDTPAPTLPSLLWEVTLWLPQHAVPDTPAPTLPSLLWESQLLLRDPTCLLPSDSCQMQRTVRGGAAPSQRQRPAPPWRAPEQKRCTRANAAARASAPAPGRAPGRYRTGAAR